VSNLRLHFTVEEEQAGLRLDKLLSLVTSDYSRTALARFIRAGHVRVAGRCRKPSYEVRPGDEIIAELPAVELDHIEPEPIPLDIVYEDDDLVVINKPAGLAVHPAGGGRGGTLVNALAYHCRTLSDINGPLRPGVIHRLDRDTSGLMLAAKHNRAHRLVAAQFRDRTVRKEYLAIVRGAPRQLEGEISLPIGRDRRVPKKMRVALVGGRPAITRYRVREQFRGFALLAVHPRTGRTHQIRVHLSHEGTPVVADALYGGGAACYPSELAGGQASPISPNCRPASGEDPLIERQALHAAQIEFTHPTTGARLTFAAPPPADFQRLLDALRLMRATTK